MSLMLSFSTNGCQTTKWGSYFTYPKSADLLLTELGLKPCQMNINIQLERITGAGWERSRRRARSSLDLHESLRGAADITVQPSQSGYNKGLFCIDLFIDTNIHWHWSRAAAARCGRVTTARRWRSRSRHGGNTSVCPRSLAEKA